MSYVKQFLAWLGTLPARIQDWMGSGGGNA